MPRRPGLLDQPADRGAHRVLLSLRAPCPSLPRPRLHRLHRSRGDHRHLQADAPGARVLSAVHGPGTRRRRDRGRARPGAGASRRGGAPERDAPVHADARGSRRSFAHVDDLLARQLRERSAAADGVPRAGQQPVRPLIDPFDVLYEAELPRYKMPDGLARIYGRLGFGDQVIYSNFVMSLDGVVTLGSSTSAGSVISGRNQADRFLMGLLRACADAVLLGAGTLRATPGHLWTPGHIFPDEAKNFAELRATLGRKPQPRLVLLTTGAIDPSHPAIVAGATIMTTAEGAAGLAGGGAAGLAGVVPDTCDVITVGESDEVDMVQAIAELRSRGHDVILTEGGPHVVGALVAHGLLDEAFITTSPVLAGRDGGERLGMVAGVELLPDHGTWSRLLSVRRHGDFLFTRYGRTRG